MPKISIFWGLCKIGSEQVSCSIHQLFCRLHLLFLGTMQENRKVRGWQPKVPCSWGANHYWGPLLELPTGETTPEEVMAPALSHPQDSSGSKQLSSTLGAPSGSFIHNHYCPQKAAWHLRSLAGNLASVTPLCAFASFSPFPQLHIPPWHEAQKRSFSSHQRTQWSQSACLYLKLIPQPLVRIRKKNLHREGDTAVFTMGSQGPPPDC